MYYYFKIKVNFTKLFLCAEAAVEWQGQAAAPQPEAAIENEACRERLLTHIQRCQALLDSRLDSIEAQVAGNI